MPARPRLPKLLLPKLLLPKLLLPKLLLPNVVLRRLVQFIVALMAFAAMPAMAVVQAPLQGINPANCQCVAQGRRFEHGETACLQGPQGPVLASCGMSLNVAAWLFTNRPCPQA